MLCQCDIVETPKWTLNVSICRLTDTRCKLVSLCAHVQYEHRLFYICLFFIIIINVRLISSVCLIVHRSQVSRCVIFKLCHNKLGLQGHE